MPAIVAALPTILELIRIAAPGFMHLINWVMAVRPVLQQNSAWSPEMEEAFIRALIRTQHDPAYQPDPPVLPPTP